MANYKYLLSEKQLHSIQHRARLLAMGSGSNLIAILYKDNELVFKTESGTTKGVIWTQRVQLVDITPEAILSAKTFKDVENLIKNGNLKVYCSCPAFLYWGVKYWAWKRGYGIEKELRKPLIRNPKGDYVACKHLYLVMQLFPFLAKSLASKFKTYYERKIETDPKFRNSLSRFAQNALPGQQPVSKKPTTPEDAVLQQLSNEINK